MEPSKLHGTWFESSEESQGERIVYRGPSFDFPRARAPRRSLTLKPDGSVSVGGLGPADAAVRSAAKWEIEDDVLTITGPGIRESYRIDSAGEDILILRRTSSGR